MGTYVPPQRPGLLEKLGPLIQLMQILRKQDVEQADALISTKRPGTAVKDIGLSRKQQQAKFGRELAPTDVAVPETAQDRADKMARDFLDTADPVTIANISSSLVSRMAGVPQITTPKGLASQAQASETESGTKAMTAKANQGLVQDALTSLDKWEPAARTALAETKTLGATQVEVQNQQRAENIKTEVQREILKAVADPNNELNLSLKKYFGVGLGSAMAAAGLGLTQLLDSIGQLAVVKARGNLAEREFQLELEKQINQADATWATDVAKNLGGKVTPRAVLNWRRWREAGGDPKKMPADVSPELDNALDIAQAAAFRTFMVENAQKGDPMARQMLELVGAAKNIKDENTLKALSQLIAKFTARSIMDMNVGPKPTEPEAAKRWDQTAAEVEAKLPKFDIHTFMGFNSGVDLTGPPKGGSLQPGAPPFRPGLGTGTPMINAQPLGGGAPGAGPAGMAPAPKPPPIQLQEINEEDRAKLQAFMDALAGYNAYQQQQRQRRPNAP